MKRFLAILTLVASLAGPILADEAGPPVGSVSPDPWADAVAANAASCHGTAAVEPGAWRDLDVDGDGSNDLVLNWAGLRCDGLSRGCGSGGCRQEVWLARPEGGWRLLLRDRIHEVHVPVPGALVLLLDSEDCDPPNSRICFRAFDAWGGTLRPLE